MEYGRMVKVTLPPLSGGKDEPVLYVVGEEDPQEAMRLVKTKVAIGSNIEVVGRVSRHLLAALKIEPAQVTQV
jgi:hypothetical protein